MRQAELLQLAADNVAFMVGELRKGTKMDKIRESNEKLQYAEGEADKVMLQLEKELYYGPYEAKEVIFLLQLLKWSRSQSTVAGRRQCRVSNRAKYS